MHANITGHRIETFPEKKFVGNRMLISFAKNRTKVLWQNFMQRRKEIRNTIGSELYSIQIYESGFFENFNPSRVFAKWAAVEVNDFDNIPFGMKTLTIPTGLYAVFNYKGASSSAAGTYQYILNEWLTNSKFRLDIRPHFEILGNKYKNEDPMSEEEIWIPVRLRKQ